MDAVTYHGDVSALFPFKSNQESSVCYSLYSEPAPEPQKKEEPKKEESGRPPGMPLDKPRVKEYEGDEIELSWEPASIPRYAKQTPIE